MVLSNDLVSAEDTPGTHTPGDVRCYPRHPWHYPPRRGIFAVHYTMRGKRILQTSRRRPAPAYQRLRSLEIPRADGVVMLPAPSGAVPQRLRHVEHIHPCVRMSNFTSLFAQDRREQTGEPRVREHGIANMVISRALA